MLEFLALLLLRIHEPELLRPFRVPGGVIGTALLGVVPTGLLVLAGLHAEHEQIAGISVWLFGTIVIAAGVAVYGACAVMRRPTATI